MTATRATTRRISAAFAHRPANRIGLVPFIPAGYPDLATTAALLPALEQAGASVIEVGFPFSDPIADGPVIQEAFVAALAKKLRIDDVLATVQKVRRSVSVPLVAMVSYSIVFRYGVKHFTEKAASAGFDGLIIPDLPPPEAQRVCEMIRAAGLETILLVAPTTTTQRRAEIARLSSGFVYYLSVAGITGERDQLPPDIAENVRELKSLTTLPVCVGFGISQPAHMAQLAPVADGAIVGSAIVRRIRANADKDPQAISRAVSDYVRQLLDYEIPPSASRGGRGSG